jgi:hypothetical protein
LFEKYVRPDLWGLEMKLKVDLSKFVRPFIAGYYRVDISKPDSASSSKRTGQHNGGAGVGIEYIVNKHVSGELQWFYDGLGGNFLKLIFKIHPNRQDIGRSLQHYLKRPIETPITPTLFYNSDYDWKTGKLLSRITDKPLSQPQPLDSKHNPSRLTLHRESDNSSESLSVEDITYKPSEYVSKPLPLRSAPDEEDNQSVQPYESKTVQPTPTAFAHTVGKEEIYLNFLLEQLNSKWRKEYRGEYSPLPKKFARVDEVIKYLDQAQLNLDDKQLVEACRKLKRRKHIYDIIAKSSKFSPSNAESLEKALQTLQANPSLLSSKEDKGFIQKFSLDEITLSDTNSSVLIGSIIQAFDERVEVFSRWMRTELEQLCNQYGVQLSKKKPPVYATLITQLNEKALDSITQEKLKAIQKVYQYTTECYRTAKKLQKNPNKIVQIDSGLMQDSVEKRLHDLQKYVDGLNKQDRGQSTKKEIQQRSNTEEAKQKKIHRISEAHQSTPFEEIKNGLIGFFSSKAGDSDEKPSSKASVSSSKRHQSSSSQQGTAEKPSRPRHHTSHTDSDRPASGTRSSHRRNKPSEDSGTQIPRPSTHGAPSTTSKRSQR